MIGFFDMVEERGEIGFDFFFEVIFVIIRINDNKFGIGDGVFKIRS